MVAGAKQAATHSSACPTSTPLGPAQGHPSIAPPYRAAPPPACLPPRASRISLLRPSPCSQRRDTTPPPPTCTDCQQRRQRRRSLLGGAATERGRPQTPFNPLTAQTPPERRTGRPRGLCRLPSSFRAACTESRRRRRPWRISDLPVRLHHCPVARMRVRVILTCINCTGPAPAEVLAYVSAPALRFRGITLHL